MLSEVVRRIGARFRKDQRGTVTVEFVLWLPVFMTILGIVTDTTILLTKHSQMTDVARTASRQVSLGLMTPHDAKRYIVSRLGSEHADYVPRVTTDGTFVTTAVSVPYRDLVIFGDFFVDGTIDASVSMIMETTAVTAAAGS